jgi:hypothetical protein
MGGVRDGFSSFKFFEALAPQSYSTGSVTGATVDKQGYETLTFVLHAGEISGEASAQNSVTSCGWIRMQDGESNAAGTVVWANCEAADIHVDLRLSGATSNTSGLTSTSMGILNVSNAGSGLAAGTIFCLGGVSADNDSFWESKAYAAGYVGDKRWVRLVCSVSAAGEMSAVGIAAIAILGLEADWPVNTIRKTS